MQETRRVVNSTLLPPLTVEEIDRVHRVGPKLPDKTRQIKLEEYSFRKASRELAMTEHTFVDWRNFVRDICIEHFLQNSVRIGGVGVEVQIDECSSAENTTLDDDQCRSSGCSVASTPTPRKGS